MSAMTVLVEHLELAAKAAREAQMDIHFQSELGHLISTAKHNCAEAQEGGEGGSV